MKRLLNLLLVGVIVALSISTPASANVRVALSSIDPNFVIAPFDAPQQVKNESDIICDGSNDQIEIQTAIGSGYRTVTLQPGNYSITGNITVASSLHLIGYGATIHLVPGTNDHMVVFPGDVADVSIDGITFDGGGSNPSGWYDILYTEATADDIYRIHLFRDKFLNADYESFNSQQIFDSIIEESYFYNAGYVHFRDHSGNRNKVINNTFDQWGYAAVGIDGRNGLYSGNTFKNMGVAPAYRIVPDGTYQQKGNKIIGETFTGNNSGEIGVYGESNYSLNLLVAMNSFDNVTYPIAGNTTTMTFVNNIVNN